jgi:hypothetical protein
VGNVYHVGTGSGFLYPKIFDLGREQYEDFEFTLGRRIVLIVVRVVLQSQLTEGFADILLELLKGLASGSKGEFSNLLESFGCDA